jgi:CHAT domain-containing protein
VLALGDPTYPAGAGTPAPAVRAFATRGVALTRLPHTRAEVTAIGRLFPRQTTVRVGAAAVKRAVEREGAGARILHFACHGLIDNQDPLASALALSPEGEQDDGLLRAYEVMEKVRLKADLVVLSACETGLGEETRHEGIVGLTRAFQYAGAKSVLVSLWSIADASTARLMGEFYRHLKAGVTKDEALRRAQVALLRSKSYTHPFYWAPFVLVGDWRR